MNVCRLVGWFDGDKLENGWTDLANFGPELFVEVQNRILGYFFFEKQNGGVAAIFNFFI